jgi:hypothetical protein
MKIIYAFCAYTTHTSKINTAIRILYRLFSCAGDSHDTQVTNTLDLSRLRVIAAHDTSRDAMTPNKTNFGVRHA